MTTLNEAKDAIIKAFNTAWGTTTPIAYDNKEFNPPVGLPWVRIAVRHQLRGQETLGGVGNRKFEAEGIAFMQIRGPLDAGTKTVDNLAQQAVDVFEGKTLTPEQVCFLDVVPQEGGEVEGEYQVVVAATFQYNQTK